MPDELEYIDCPICGPAGVSEFAVEDGWHIVKCSGCGLLYVNPRRNTEDLINHFQETYIDNQDRVEVHFIAYRESSLGREAAKIRQFLPQGGRLIDIGSASGAFLKNFAGDPQWQVEGVEPSHFAVKYAREQFGLKIHEGFLIDQHFPEVSFDVITCLDTFSLISDPRAELAEIARILKPGGLLALEIPGFRFRMLKNTSKLVQLIVPGRFNPKVHLFFYSQQTLTRLVGLHGFKLLVSYPEQSPIYGSRLLRWLNRLYFFPSAGLYRASHGKINIAPKEFIIYQKENG